MSSARSRRPPSTRRFAGRTAEVVGPLLREPRDQRLDPLLEAHPRLLDEPVRVREEETRVRQLDRRVAELPRAPGVGRSSLPAV
jgi:hypothetical protein